MPRRSTSSFINMNYSEYEDGGNSQSLPTVDVHHRRNQTHPETSYILYPFQLIWSIFSVSYELVRNSVMGSHEGGCNIDDNNLRENPPENRLHTTHGIDNRFPPSNRIIRPPPPINRSPVIGIDFGTSKCCVAVVRKGKVEIISNDRAKRTTPSYVAFADTERLIGDEAKSKAASNPKNTFYEIKRLMGRSFADLQVQTDIENWPFKVVDRSNKACIEVNVKGKPIILFPEQICSMLLTEMKKMAEKHLGCSVDAAVISVPACFNEAQRQATIDAANIAGLEVKALLNEPTAAAIAYIDNKPPSHERKTISVFDMGAGSMDLTVMDVDVHKNSIEVRSCNGKSHFGGQDLDVLLMKFMESSMKSQLREAYGRSEKGKIKLKKNCEKSKENLTLLPHDKTSIDCLVGTEDFEKTISRVEFEREISNVLRHNIKEVFEKNLWTSRIEELILVGGSTRIPCVKKVLKEYWKEPFNESVNADEAAAHGAAYWAAVISGDTSVSDMYITELISHPDYQELQPIDLLKLHTGTENGVIILPDIGGFYREYKSQSKGLQIEDLKRSIEEHDEFEKEAENQLNCDIAMNDLEYCCNELKKLGKTSSNNECDWSSIINLSNELIDWLTSHVTATLKDCECQKGRLVDLCSEVAKNDEMAKCFSSILDEKISPKIKEQVNTSHGAHNTIELDGTSSGQSEIPKYPTH